MAYQAARARTYLAEGLTLLDVPRPPERRAAWPTFAGLYGATLERIERARLRRLRRRRRACRR